jgi:hypothetical protein
MKPRLGSFSWSCRCYIWLRLPERGVVFFLSVGFTWIPFSEWDADKGPSLLTSRGSETHVTERWNADLSFWLVLAMVTPWSCSWLFYKCGGNFDTEIDCFFEGVTIFFDFFADFTDFGLRASTTDFSYEFFDFALSSGRLTISFTDFLWLISFDILLSISLKLTCFCNGGVS